MSRAASRNLNYMRTKPVNGDDLNPHVYKLNENHLKQATANVIVNANSTSTPTQQKNPSKVASTPYTQPPTNDNNEYYADEIDMTSASMPNSARGHRNPMEEESLNPFHADSNWETQSLGSMRSDQDFLERLRVLRTQQARRLALIEDEYYQSRGESSPRVARSSPHQQQMEFDNDFAQSSFPRRLSDTFFTEFDQSSQFHFSGTPSNAFDSWEAPGSYYHPSDWVVEHQQQYNEFAPRFYTSYPPPDFEEPGSEQAQMYSYGQDYEEEQPQEDEQFYLDNASDAMWEEYQQQQRKGPKLKRRNSFSGFGGAVHSLDLPRKHKGPTVPKPFSFEQREQQRLEQKQLKKYEMDLGSSQRSFGYYHPVPGFVKKRIFEKMYEEEAAKRNLKVAKNIRTSLNHDALRKRELVRKKMAEMEAQKAQEEKDAMTQFKASPLPKKILSPKFDEIKKKEMMRKEIIAAKAQEKVKIAALPPRMQQELQAERPVTPHEKTHHKVHKRVVGVGDPTSDFVFAPKISKNVPNFEKIHDNWERQMQQKPRKQPTKFKEFNLQTQEIPSNKSKVILDMKMEERVGKELRWPYKATRGKVPQSSPVFAPPNTQAKSTTAAEMKKKVNEMHSKVAKTEAEKKAKEEEIKRKRQSMMTKMIKERIGPGNSRVKNEEITQKAKQLKKDQEKASEEYRNELQLALKRMELERPFLFERLDRDTAKVKALEKADRLIAQAGLRPEEFKYQVTQRTAESAKYAHVDPEEYRNRGSEDEDDDEDEEDEEEEDDDEDEDEEEYEEDEFEEDG